MDNKKWTDSDLQIAYEDGCKFFNINDLKDFLLKRREFTASTESKCNKHIVMQRSELLKFAEWEKGKNLTEHYEWEGASGVLELYLKDIGVDII
jgi:hypothetical protein